MSSSNQPENSTMEKSGCGISIESVNRISKIPLVESTVQTATTLYGKVKDYNTITHWTLSTAESTVNKAIEVGKPIATPVVQSLEKPIKKVDEMICTGLDYVESKVPALKLPPGEILLQMYNNAKEYIDTNVTPKVQNAYSTVEPTIQTAKHLVEPAIQSAKNFVEPAVTNAKNVVEPAVQSAYHMVEPIVQPAVDKVNQYLHFNDRNSSLEHANDIQEPSEKNIGQLSSKVVSTRTDQ